MSKLDIISKLSNLLKDPTWEESHPFFTKDVFYKIGAEKPVFGPKAMTDRLSAFYKAFIPSGHPIREAWEIGNTVILEIDAYYTRASDGKRFTIPCVDIYKFEGEQIKEWRVYPDLSEIYR
jgi:hypothetical protein